MNSVNHLSDTWQAESFEEIALSQDLDDILDALVKPFWMLVAFILPQRLVNMFKINVVRRQHLPVLVLFISIKNCLECLHSFQ